MRLRVVVRRRVLDREVEGVVVLDVAVVEAGLELRFETALVKKVSMVAQTTKNEEAKTHIMSQSGQVARTQSSSLAGK